MKGKHYTTGQLVGFLKDHESSAMVANPTRPNGFSEQSFCRGKAKFCVMDASEVKRLRELEAENAKLERFRAEAELSKPALRDVVGTSRGEGPPTFGPRVSSKAAGSEQAASARLDRHGPDDGSPRALASARHELLKQKLRSPAEQYPQ